jgi:hypothetical protein
VRAREQRVGVAREHVGLELDEQRVVVARVLAQRGAAPAVGVRVAVAHGQAEVVQTLDHLRERHRLACRVEEPAAREVREHLARRVLAVGANRVEHHARLLAQRLGREAGEVDPAAAVVAAVVRTPRGFPDRVDRHGLGHGERADAARVTLGGRRRRGEPALDRARLGFLRRSRRSGSRLRRGRAVIGHHEQIGAPAQLADVVDQSRRVGHAPVGAQRAALAVQRVDEHRELHQIEYGPVAEPRAHLLAIVLHRQLVLRRDAAARTIEVTVAALVAAERHRLADARLDEPVRARDQHLDHVQLAAQTARGEQPRAALRAERRAIQIADRLQLAAAVEIDRAPTRARGACAAWYGTRPASRRATSRRDSCPSRRCPHRRADSRRRSSTTCRRPRSACSSSR